MVQESDLRARPLTGYGAKTLPGVREAIEEQRWADAGLHQNHRGRLNAYSARLDQATAVLTKAPSQGVGDGKVTSGTGG